MMLLSTTANFMLSSQTQQADSGESVTSGIDKNSLLAKELKDKLPEEMRSLTPQEDEDITRVLSNYTGLVLKPELEGIRLNRTYGMIGGEQHLYRYPGDILEKHAKSSSDWAMFGGSGIAPGLGAWGYFSPSQAQFNAKDEERERWYIAVQTFLAPGFAKNLAVYRDFFKYRKMV